MATEVLYDSERDVACLYEPNAKRAFGPVVDGDRGRELLKAYIGAVYADPACLKDFEVDQTWVMFQDMVEREADSAGDVDSNPDPVPADPGVDGDVAEGAAPPAPEPEPAPQLATPVNDSEIPPDMKRCPRCEGWGEAAEGGVVVTCPVCNGDKVVTAD